MRGTATNLERVENLKKRLQKARRTVEGRTRTSKAPLRPATQLPPASVTQNVENFGDTPGATTKTPSGTQHIPLHAVEAIARAGEAAGSAEHGDPGKKKKLKIIIPKTTAADKERGLEMNPSGTPAATGKAVCPQGQGATQGGVLRNTHEPSEEPCGRCQPLIKQLMRMVEVLTKRVQDLEEVHTRGVRNASHGDTQRSAPARTRTTAANLGGTQNPGVTGIKSTGNGDPQEPEPVRTTMGPGRRSTDGRCPPQDKAPAAGQRSAKDTAPTRRGTRQSPAAAVPEPARGPGSLKRGRRGSQKLTQAQCESVVRGELPFELAEYKLLYFRGVSANRPSLIKAVLRSGGISTRMYSSVGYTEDGILEIAVNSKMCEKVIAHMSSLNGVVWQENLSPVCLTDAAQMARDIVSLKKRTAWMAGEGNFNLPARRLGRLIERLTVERVEQCLGKILFLRRGPVGEAGQSA